MHTIALLKMLVSLVSTLALATLSLSAPLAPAQLPFSSPSTSALPPLSALSIPPQHLDQLLQHIASLPEKRLVQLAHDAAPIAITEGEKALLLIAGKRFVDVTDEVTFLSVQEAEVFPSKVSTPAYIVTGSCADPRTGRRHSSPTPRATLPPCST